MSHRSTALKQAAMTFTIAICRFLAVLGEVSQITANANAHMAQPT